MKQTPAFCGYGMKSIWNVKCWLLFFFCQQSYLKILAFKDIGSVQGLSPNDPTLLWLFLILGLLHAYKKSYSSKTDFTLFW